MQFSLIHVNAQTATFRDFGLAVDQSEKATLLNACEMLRLFWSHRVTETSVAGNSQW